MSKDIPNLVFLGDKVKDKVTGFEGIVISIHCYLSGCRRITVQPEIDKDGKFQNDGCFDEPMLTIIDHRYFFKNNKIDNYDSLINKGGDNNISVSRSNSHIR